MIKQQDIKNEIIEQDKFKYSLNFQDKTASIIGYEIPSFPLSTENICIPRSVIHDYIEYKIINVSKNAFSSPRIKSIQFPTDSELQTIEADAFNYTSLESLSLPSSLMELKANWCSGLSNLTTIKIESNNRLYCVYDDKMIIGKTSIESENYDNLVFCVRNVESITIPSFIKHIESYAFELCKKLSKIEIKSDSKLETIGEYAFCNTSIEYFTISPHLTKITSYSFSNCYNLRKIDVGNDSRLKTIENNAFNQSSIESITIPSSLVDLEDGWCNETPKLTEIKINPNNQRYSIIDEKIVIGKSSKVESNNQSFDDKMIVEKTSTESDNFDIIVFCARDIESVTIPSFIKHIGSYAFNYCQKLVNVEIPSNSELQTIEDFAFAASTIQSLKIPSQLTKIGDCSFFECYKLRSVEMQANTKLQLIGKSAFFHSIIQNFLFPPQITKMNEVTFGQCFYLKKIEFPINSKLQIIDQFAFDSSSIEYISIPSHVIEIGQYAFSECRLLKKVEIPNDSQLQIIDKFAFYCTSIESFKVPPKLIKINNNCFCYCKKLQIVEYDENSSLEIIDLNIYNESEQVVILIPTTLQKRISFNV